MKTSPSEKLQIPLVDFLKHNDYGLLEKCNELNVWLLFLNYISNFFETDSFIIRGSSIAQALIKMYADLPDTIIDHENDSESMDIKHVLVPYTSINIFLRSYPMFKIKLDKDDPGYQEKIEDEKYSVMGQLTLEEYQFFEPIIAGSNKKNIDIYLNTEHINDIYSFSTQFVDAFNKKQKYKITSIRLFPNGVAALEIKGGYVDHCVNIIIKPPVNKDLRKNMSDRQLASKAILVRDGNIWNIEIEFNDVVTMLSEEKLRFLDKDLDLSELILQVSRSLRFNSIYKMEGISEISETDLELTVKKLNDQLEFGKITEESNKYTYANSTNEFMLSFLHDPKLFIDFLLMSPPELFPYIDRQAVLNNQDKIVKLLSGKISGYSTTDKSQNTDLALAGSYLVGNSKDSLYKSEVGQRFKPIIDSVDEKIGLSEKIDQEFTHTAWQFDVFTDYYLFRTLFTPL